MSDIPTKRIWGNDETQLDEPPISLQDEGNLGGDQIFNEHYNWVINQADKNQNDLVHRSNYAQSLAAGAPISFQTSGFWNLSDWMHSYSTKNQITLASYPRTIIPGWNYTFRRQSVLVARDGYQGITELHNGADGTIVGTDHPLTLDNGAEEIDAIACDGPFVYVLTVGKPGFSATFYKFNTNPWGPTKEWAIDTVLTYNQQLVGHNSIVIANTNWIAAPITGMTSDSGTSVQLFNKDGLSGLVGRGNGPSNSLYLPAPRIISNGTNIFFALEDTGAPGQFPTFCSANIADPTIATNPSGPIVSNAINATTQNAGIGDFTFDGRLIHCFSGYGEIFSYDWETDTFQGGTHANWLVQDMLLLPVGTRHPSMTFDGLRNWVLAAFEGDVVVNSGFVMPIEVAAESMDDSGAKSVSGPKTMVTEPFPATPAFSGTRMAFADNCLWMTTDISLGTPGTTLMRLPIARR